MYFSEAGRSVDGDDPTPPEGSSLQSFRHRNDVGIAAIDSDAAVPTGNAQRRAKSIFCKSAHTRFHYSNRLFRMAVYLMTPFLGATRSQHYRGNCVITSKTGAGHLD
jgi:hypothetical protein